ncbi:MAG: tRNA dihydrouridine(16) synthase DusC [Gammaproteobacteria bacterium]|nr:tRNA dihydrouridine(16) synthase DusC [Gammaproteobacteria bacterium]
MKLTLAPLEGVIDHLVRELLTGIGGFDLCITEFLRVTQSLQPERVFYKICPELHQGGRTKAGVPVRMQLLGQSPQYLSENANLAIELGSHGIDLNLGCPSKIVNTNKGGAVLLKEPETIYQIVSQMRKAIPKQHIFSVKIRLGWDEPTSVFEIADAIEQAGASELTIHARTKVDGYKAEQIKWHLINEVKQKQSIKIIANGEVWQRDDATQCRLLSGCDDLMIGRGVLAMPNLANVIKHDSVPLTYPELLTLLVEYSRYEIAGDKGQYYPNRIKQWMVYLKFQYPQIKTLFRELRIFQTTDPIVELLHREVQIHG